MIREKGEALSPVKINTNVWSNSAVQGKGLFTVCVRLPPVTLYGPDRETDRKGWGRGEDEGGRKEGRGERTGAEEEDGRSPEGEKGGIGHGKTRGE